MGKSRGSARFTGVAVSIPVGTQGAVGGETAEAEFAGTWGCILFRVGGAAGSGPCTAGWHALEIAKNSSYRMGPSQSTVSAPGRKASFGGGLAFVGPAEMTEPSRFEFQWRDAEGFSYWAVFIRTPAK
jgi:hypothetical protein